MKRTHTDGFVITNTNNDQLHVGLNTGELKCEKVGHVIVENSINVSWNNAEKIFSTSYLSFS